MRVIVSGAKTWPYPTVVQRALDLCLGQTRRAGARLTVVHGAPGWKLCAEAVADDWAEQRYRTMTHLVDPPERHPADWRGPCRSSCSKGHRRVTANEPSTCPSAGFYRIDDMLNRGVDLGLIFLDDGPVPVWVDYLTRQLIIERVPIQHFHPTERIEETR